MSSANSLLQDLLQAFPNLRSQMYFKPSLTALSHALEDIILAGNDCPLIIANFQQERYFRQEIRRYRQIFQKTKQVYILATPEADSSFAVVDCVGETIPLNRDDSLAKEWHLVILGQSYSACLVCQEIMTYSGILEQTRRFEGFWTSDAQVSRTAATLLLERIIDYRPELNEKVELAKQVYGLDEQDIPIITPISSGIDSEIFAQRLMTYLQASQYKLLKAYTNLTALNRQLERLERTQSNLIALVSHELRTPLSTMRMCLESLVDEADMDQEIQQEMLAIALGDSERMRRLIQDFLTLSKLETGQAYRRPEAIQLSEALDLSLSGLKTSYSGNKIPKIKLKIPPQLPLLRADGDGLVEVFSKLLDNACKFTPPEGEIQISVQALETTKLEVIITDTGRGIEPSQLEAIFSLFYQEEDWLRRNVGGTGLGLAICQKIIQSMGGKIWAFSAGRNQGSEFHFTVPIEQM